MLPLRFPNNGIKAKRRQRGGGAASHSQPPCRVGHPWLGRGQGQPAREAGVAHRRSNPQGRSVPFARAAAHWGDVCGNGRLRPARKGGSCPRGHLLVERRPQRGPAARCPQGAAGSRGGRPLAGWLPASKGSRRLRRGSSGGVDGAIGVRASF
ncbi:hypothetical protein GW17_00037768 [Ensete ventricosum]|nr:hypothetical protein GW17_00037768 [Ensete ventricosum]